MIRNYLFTTLCFFSFLVTHAQFKVVDNNGNQLPNGYTFITDTEDEKEAKFFFNVIKDAPNSDKIYIRLCCKELTNTNGDPFYVFFPTDGIHIHSVKEGECYDEGNELFEATDEGFEFGFHNPEAGVSKSWKFCLEHYDVENNRSKNSFCFTYKYDPNFSIKDAQLKNVNVYPTTIKNSFKVETSEQLGLSIYNLSGRLIKEEIVNDNKVLDLSQLSAQPYILNFTNDKGQRYIKKITVQ